MPDSIDNSNFRPTLSTSPRSRLLLSTLYLLLVTAGIFALLSNWAFDDPFITYRYAHNLAHGLGFVYNPGERILSTTTPLFAMLLALLSIVSTNLPKLANLIGAFSLVMGGLLLWDLARTWKTPVVGWVALFLYPVFTLPAATLGSETPLYIALCLGAFAVYARQHYALTAVLAATASLTRPDGILVAVVLVVDYLLRTRKPIPWKAVLLFLGLLLPWVVFAWLYFGSPLPITLAAKRQQGTMAVSQTFAPGFLWILGWYKGGWQYWVEAILAVLGIFWMVRHARQWFLLLTWSALYFVAYSLLGVSRYFWYYAPLVPGFIILVGLGIDFIAHQLKKAILRSKKVDSNAKGPPRSGAYLLVGGLIMVLAIAQFLDLWQLSKEPDPRAETYRDVAAWINANTPEDALIGSLEVGIIGYYADRRMVDFAGLIRPEVIQKLGNSANYEEAAKWTAENLSPDYIALVKGDLQSLKTAYIQKHCKVAANFQSDNISPANGVSIYHCQ
jgi:arabinofuranosyltransferase